MASSSFPAGAAVKFWVPNLGARAPVDLATGLPDYSEYVRSGLWVQRRRLRVCDGTGLTAYMPEGDRSWPDTFPVANMKIRQTYCHMDGVTQEKVLNPLNALEILEGQVALVHHIMAFEEANPAVHVLAPRQKWKATFLAYFLGAVSQGQLTIMKQLGDEAYAAGLADSLGRYNDALFENIDRDLQAFRWAPHKILGCLLGNTKSRFTVHVQLRRLDYDDVPSIDWYILACRPCKVIPECLTLLTLRLLESPSRWTVAEPLAISFTQPTTKTGKASRTRDSPWVTPGKKASPAAWPFTWSRLGARRRRGMGRRSSMASTSSPGNAKF